MRVAVYRICGIGDAVQLTPLFQQIRADLPDAELVFLTSENVEAMMQPCPLLDRCVAFPASLTSGRYSEFGNVPLWWKIRRQGAWDYFLNFEPRYRRSIGSMFISSRHKVGYITPGWKPIPLFTHPLREPGVAAPDAPHISSYYLKAWTAVSGFADRGFGYDMRFLLKCSIPVPPLPERYLCLAPGSGNFACRVDIKRWPREYWLDLAKSLRAAGWTLAWLGSREDAEAFSPPQEDCNLLGKVNLIAAAHVIARSEGLIGNDSGMFHLALGLGQRAAGFYGPTSSTHVGPFRSDDALVLKVPLPCVPCQATMCLVDLPEYRNAPRPYCMTSQHPAEVFPRLLAHFSSRPAKNCAVP